MKLFLVLSLLGLLVAQQAFGSAVRTTSVEQKIADEIDFIRSFMTTGNAELGIPCLEPLSLEDLNLDVNAKGLQATVSASSIRVKGVSAFSVTGIHQTGDKVAISISVPSVTATGQYESDGKLKVTFIKLPVNGKGPFTINLTGLTAVATLGADLDNSGKLSVSSVDVSYNLKKLSLDFQGLYGGGIVGKSVNKALNSMATTVEKSLHSKIQALANKIVLDHINEFLEKAQTTARGAALTNDLIMAAFEHFAASQ